MPLTVLELNIENVKRIQRITIVPVEPVVQITGRNGQGKSTVLDSIVYALCGKSAIPDRPVRDGHEHEGAEITVDLGEFTVTRRWAPSGTSSVMVESKDGARYRSPQDMLDKLLGTFLDPLAFSRMKPAEQIAAVRKCIPIDWDAVDGAEEEFASAFKEANAGLKAASSAAAAAASKAKLAAVEAGIAPDVNVTRVDTDEIAKKIEEQSKLDAETWRLKHDIDAALVALERRLADLEVAKAAVARIAADVDNLNTRINEGRRVLDARSTEAPELPLSQQLETMERRNRVADLQAEAVAAANRAAFYEDALARVKESRALKRAEVSKAIAEHPLPVPGLVLTPDGDLLFSGVPFSQASSSERIRIGLGLAAALSHDVRVVLIYDGSLLDSQSMAAVQQFAMEAGCQVWIERVTDGGQFGILIEDGQVVAAGE